MIVMMSLWCDCHKKNCIDRLYRIFLYTGYIWIHDMKQHLSISDIWRIILYMIWYSWRCHDTSHLLLFRPSSMNIKKFDFKHTKRLHHALWNIFPAIHEPISLGRLGLDFPNVTPVKETNQLPHHASSRGNFRRCSWTHWTPRTHWTLTPTWITWTDRSNQDHTRAAPCVACQECA